MEVKVPVEEKDKFFAYMEKINRRCRKMNVAPLDYFMDNVQLTENSDNTYSEIHTFVIEGSTPKIDGWVFIGRIEHDADVGNVLRNSPQFKIPERFWESSGECDHCHTKRQRKDTFILLNTDTGEYKQIGRQCVRDFIGYDHPADMVWYCNIESSLKEEVESYGRSSFLCEVNDVLRRSMAIIADEGFISVAKSDEFHVPTSHLVQNTYTKTVGNNEWATEVCRKSVSYDQKSLDITNWVLGWDSDRQRKTEFNWNVFSFVTRGYCRIQDIGFIACLPVLFDKEMNETTEKMERSNEFVGVVGEKRSFNVTHKKTVIFDGYYGRTFMYMFADDTGNDIVWTSASRFDLDVGENVNIFGTIKAHKVYNGRNQTSMTRCTISEVK